MKLTDLKSHIMQNKMDKFYVFTGDEIGIQKIYLEQISKKKALDIIRIETVAEVFAQVGSTGFFANEPHIYVVRGDKNFQKEEKHWDDVLMALKDSMLILLYDKIDSRLKFGKHFKDNVVEFEKLDRPVLVKYIQKRLPLLSSDNANKLADICGDSYDICMLECEKLDDYVKIGTNKAEKGLTLFMSHNEAMNTLIADGTIYQSQETDVFAFTGAVCGHNIQESFKLATMLKESGVSAITSLGTLYNSMRAVMLIQCCEGGNVAEITGLDKGSIWYNKKYVGKYNISDLVYGVKFIAETVSKIKNGYIEDAYAVEYVLSHIL